MTRYALVRLKEAKVCVSMVFFLHGSIVISATYKQLSSSVHCFIPI